jgi:two-component SAPR family response regulator
MKYDKDRETAKKMYDLLLEKQPQALKRAEMLAAQYDRNNKSHADKNPFTTVYELVNELNKHVKS